MIVNFNEVNRMDDLKKLETICELWLKYKDVEYSYIASVIQRCGMA